MDGNLVASFSAMGTNRLTLVPLNAMAPSTQRVASLTKRMRKLLVVSWPAVLAILAKLSELPRMNAKYLKNKP